MKTFLAALLATAFTLSAVPAFACGGHGAADDTTTTSVEGQEDGAKKDAKKSAKKDTKKEKKDGDA